MSLARYRTALLRCNVILAGCVRFELTTVDLESTVLPIKLTAYIYGGIGEIRTHARFDTPNGFRNRPLMTT